MSTTKKEILKALDREIDARPESLTPKMLRLYRSLLIRYISEMSLTLTRQAPAVP